MKNKYSMGLNAFLISCIVGCAHLAEVPKEIWGSSTKALEEARSVSESKTYLGSVDQCLNRVLEIANDKKLEVLWSIKENKWLFS